MNSRVTRWSRRSATRTGETIINNISCFGLTIDDEGSLYVTDIEKHEVRRYPPGDTNGIVVAGGNGQGEGLHQLNCPRYLCMDGEHAVYVSDNQNHRVMKWVKDAEEGIVVAGGRGQGTDLTKLSHPQGVRVDATGNVYVADYQNDRVMRWSRGATRGTVVAGGNGDGEGENHFNGPTGLSFDRYGHLYVADYANYRVQRFALEKNWIKNIFFSLSLNRGNTCLSARDPKTVSDGGHGGQKLVLHEKGKSTGDIETQQCTRQSRSCATVTKTVFWSVGTMAEGEEKGKSQ